MKSKLLVIDGNYFAYRMFFGSSAMYSYTLQYPINAIVGVTRKIYQILDIYSPDYAVVVFDSPEPTFRHKLSPLYKAHRDTPPEEFRLQLPYIQRIISAVGLATLISPGLEGDDLMGALARLAVTHDIKAIISTGDKDILQLINPNVEVVNHFTLMKYTDKNVKEKFGIDANRIADYLALVGDVADGIGGVKGIGAAKAKKLISQYSSFEEIMYSSDLSYYLNQGITSIESMTLDRKLTEIDCNCLTDLSLEQFIIQSPDFEELDLIYDEIGTRGSRDLIKVCKLLGIRTE